MSNYIYIYPNCVFYEIVLLGYFLKSTNHPVIYCSSEKNSILTWEGFSVTPSITFEEVATHDVTSLIIPGGDISQIDKKNFSNHIGSILQQDIILGAICAGVNFLEELNIIEGKKTVLSENVDICIDCNLITAKANAYVDFALQIGKKLNIFIDESDYDGTVKFFKYFQSI